jgi:hypothetical protein
MFPPARSSSGALKLGGNAVPSVLLLSVFVILIIIMNEVHAVHPSMPHALSFLVCQFYI